MTAGEPSLLRLDRGPLGTGEEVDPFPRCVGFGAFQVGVHAESRTCDDGGGTGLAAFIGELGKDVVGDVLKLVFRHLSGKVARSPAAVNEVYRLLGDEIGKSLSVCGLVDSGAEHVVVMERLDHLQRFHKLPIRKARVADACPVEPVTTGGALNEGAEKAALHLPSVTVVHGDGDVTGIADNLTLCDEFLPASRETRDQARPADGRW